MTVAIITGSAGLIGSEAAAHFAGLGMDVVGIDNDMRRVFFGDEASTTWKRQELEKQLGTRYTHVNADIRDADAIDRVFCAPRSFAAAASRAPVTRAPRSTAFSPTSCAAP